MKRDEITMIERRIYPATALELRATKDGDDSGIAGTGIVIGQRTDLGGFTESIAPGAVDDALKSSDIRGLFNHDPNFVLGRVKSGTMAVELRDGAVAYAIPKMPKARADVVEAIERGDVSGGSFSFITEEDTWERNADGTEHRTIVKIREIWDMGPVTFPAYPQTDVALRSLAAWRTKAPEPSDAWKVAHATRRRRLDLALHG